MSQLASIVPSAAIGPTAYWYLTRATGIVALLLLTLVVVLGVIGVSGSATSSRWPRFAISTLHRDASLLVIVVLVIHIVTTVLDSFAPINLIDAVVPFISAYRPLWLGLGAVAFDLLIALTITSLMRRRLGYGTWRAIHWLAYVSWPVAVLHGLGTGSDSKQTWALVLTSLCVLVVLAAVIARVAQIDALSEGRRSLAIVTAVFTTLVIAVFTLLGPLAPGWAKRAGTPEPLLASTKPVTQVSTTSGTRTSFHPSTLKVPFDANLTGTLQQRQVAGGAIIDLELNLSGGTNGRLRLRLGGLPEGGGLSLTGSQVDLIAEGAPAVLQGSVVQLRGDSLLARVTAQNQAPLTLYINLNIDNQTGTVTGTLRAKGPR